MMVSFCAWHPKLRGYPKFLRVVSWRGWRLHVSHGLCRRCLATVRKKELAPCR